jgi:hypothetical protein
MIKFRKKSGIDKPPFEIGDRVVYIGRLTRLPVYDPNGYIIDKIYQCQSTREWFIDMPTKAGPRLAGWNTRNFTKIDH